MEKIEIREFASMCGGESFNIRTGFVSGIAFDTRRIQKNDAFFALRGKRDGHSFLKEAQKAGASSFVISKKKKEVYKNSILTKDTLAALHRFSSAYRRKMSDVKVACITGSNGKTTSRAMTAAILSCAGKTVTNPGNFNNHIGVPVSLSLINKDTEFAVLELGGNHTGEIRELSEIACPDAAVITNITKAHIGELKSMGNVLRMKLGIFDGMKVGGIAILNTDDKLLGREFARIRGAKISFGFDKGADIHPAGYTEIKEGIESEFAVCGKKIKALLKCRGLFNLYNAMSALGIAEAFGIRAGAMEKGLSAFRPVQSRMNIIKKGKSVIIDDSYNANPESMSLAVKEAEKISVAYGLRPLVYVIGDMLELGKYSAREHRLIGDELIGLGPDAVFTVGRLSEVIHRAAGKAGIEALHYKKQDDAVNDLKKRIAFGGVFLFKASHGIGLSRLVLEIMNSDEKGAMRKER